MVKEVKGYITLKDVEALNNGEEVFIYHGKSVKLYLKLVPGSKLEIITEGDD